MEARYIDHMGDDLRVVNAARVSFKKHKEVFDEESDTKLINYLARNGHWTPFSHPMITMYEKVPIFVARQRFKHMVGFTYNEVSRRYVDDPPEFYEPCAWRMKAEDKKQGSGDLIPDDHSSEWDGLIQDDCYGLLWEADYVARRAYTELIDGGVAQELARMVLPQSMYTEYYTTGSLAAWARAYKLRSHKHAQKEIRDLADMWDTIIRPLFPVSWEALTSDGQV